MTPAAPPPPPAISSIELEVEFQSLGGTNVVCVVSVMMNVAVAVAHDQVIVTVALAAITTA
jgi:hypothetical protein